MKSYSNWCGRLPFRTSLTTQKNLTLAVQSEDHVLDSGSVSLLWQQSGNLIFLGNMYLKFPCFVLYELPLERALCFKTFENMKVISLYWLTAQYLTCFTQNLLQNLMNLILMFISKRKSPKNA